MIALKRTGQFRAIGADGKTYDIIEWSRLHDVSTIHDAGPKHEAVLEKLTLENGDHVNSVGKDEYTVVRTGVRLRKRT